MEQPPVNTDTQLTEYLFRQLSALENKSLQLGNLTILTALPTKPTVGKIYYFANAILPTIVAEGAYVYRSTGWSSITLGVPYGAFHDTTTQTAIGATVTAVTLNSTDLSNGISIGSPTSRIVISIAGIYNIQFSMQLSNASATDDDITIWFRKNGVNISNSASLASVPSKHGSTNGHAILTVNLLVNAATNDYFELYWTTDIGTSSILTYPASAIAPIHPQSPSVIVTVTLVSIV